MTFAIVVFVNSRPGNSLVKMATLIASMRFSCTIFQPVLTLRCHSVNMKRYVRRRRCVSGLISVNESIENSKRVVSQNENILQENIFRNAEKASIQRPDCASYDTQSCGNISDSVQFSQLPQKKVINADRYDNHQFTTLSRFGEVDGLLYEKAQPGDKSLTWVILFIRLYWHLLLRDSCLKQQRKWV